MADAAPELAGILDAAARGRFPSPDGSVTIVPQPSRREAGVLAFTAHSVVFADEDPGWIRSTLDSIRCDPLAATMNPHFLAALMDRTGRWTDTIDLLTVATPLPGEPPLPLREIAGNARSVRAFQAAGYRPVAAEALLY